MWNIPGIFQVTTRAFESERTGTHTVPVSNMRGFTNGIGDQFDGGSLVFCKALFQEATIKSTMVGLALETLRGGSRLRPRLISFGAATVEVGLEMDITTREVIRNTVAL
jgi:hypothetical protein